MVDYRAAVSLVRDLEVVGGQCRAMAAGETVIYNLSGYKGAVIKGFTDYQLNANLCADSACSSKLFTFDITVSSGNIIDAGVYVNPTYSYLKLTNPATGSKNFCFTVFGVR